MRNAFIAELLAAAHDNANIALVVGDLGYNVVEPFAESFPDRFFNAGVAEQNMMGLAAGLASEGMHVFVYSIANFPIFRCAEQLRNDVDYHKLPVTVVSVGGGLAYGNLGYSHHAVQDYALMRVLPNMVIAAPGDPNEVRGCMRYLLSNPGPSYLRLGKAGELLIHDYVPELEPGRWIPVHQPTDSTDQILLTTGGVLELANHWIKSEQAAGYSLYSLPIWGIRDKSIQVEQVAKWKNVTTVEDHLIDGGFGSWFLEALSTQPELLVRMKLRGLDPLVCGLVGQQDHLNVLGGLDRDNF
ncbi:MAG: transketolase [Halioglobus sp.]